MKNLYKDLVRYWWDKAESSLESAKREHLAGEQSFAINRLYYAMFYAVSAWMLMNGKTFKKHSGVRAAFHQQIIKPGLLNKKWSKLYDQLFEDRNDSDYVPLVTFENEYVEMQIRKCSSFLKDFKKLLFLYERKG